MHESKSSYDVLQWKEVISISVVLTLGKTCLKKKEKRLHIYICETGKLGNLSMVCF